MADETMADETMAEQAFDSPRVLVIGAHPDDCEAGVGGTAALWAEAGASVTLVSMTDGSGGHHERRPEELIDIRRREAAAAARALGVESRVLGNRDGHLEPSLERRLEVIAMIRRARPDLVITHRPVDYHPDHRYTSVLVQDAAYMVTVPHVCPDVPHLASNPVFAYMEDRFTRPSPFRADVVVDIDSVIEKKWDAIRAHRSQFFEWLPFNQGILDRVPPDDDPAGQDRFLREWAGPWLLAPGDRYRRELVERYGETRGRRVKNVEAFEISEYGRPLEGEALGRFFPL